jgi:hypothetical protein
MEVKRHADIVLSLLWIPKYEMLLSTSVDPQVLGWDVVNGGARVKVRKCLIGGCFLCSVVSWLDDPPVACYSRRLSSPGMRRAFVRWCTLRPLT